jgi:hypothetical protein
VVDVVCFDDLDLQGAEMDDPVAELEQDCYHRLIEMPGSNPDDVTRGLGLISLLSGPIDNSLGSKIDAELRKDDRVESTAVTITETGTGEYKIEIQIQPEGSIVILSSQKQGVTRLA